MLQICDDIENIPEEKLLEDMAQLPEWRRREAMRYSHAAGRRESVLAFRLLQEMTGLRDMEFVIGKHGKPAIKGRPDLHFNFSHCHCAVACAVDAVPVGVDIERMGRYTLPLAERTLSEEELHDILYTSPDGLTRRTAEDTDVMFTVLWTKKEALLKLLGTGIGLTENIRHVLADYDDKVVFHTTVNKACRYVCTEVHFKGHCQDVTGCR